MDVNGIRQDFPILKSGVIYLDNTATSLTPEPVLDAMLSYYRECRANIHRGAHTLSKTASERYEKAHDKIAGFVNASPDEIVMTKNTSEAISLVALSLNLKKGDKVVTTGVEHHSNFLPWLSLKKKGVNVEVVMPNRKGEFKTESFENLIDKDTKIVAMTHISNVLGNIYPVEKIGKIAKENGSLFLVDAAQSAPHIPIDVEKIGCDFLAFSGHKMLGPTGIGALYIRNGLLSELEPPLIGGGTIEDVSVGDYRLSKSYERWEAGTPNIAGTIGLAAAVDYLKKIGFESIARHEQKLLKKIVSSFSEIKNLEFYGTSKLDERAGIVPFNITGMNPHDVAILLDENAKIAVRSGHHCAMPLMKEILNLPDGTVRASVYIYNTEQEIQALIENVGQIATQLA